MSVMTTREYLSKTLIGVITDIQRKAGRDVPKITDDTVPFSHVSGFDSLCGVEAAVLISERVAVEIDQIPFLSPTGGHLLRLRDIVDALVTSHGHQVVIGAVAVVAPADKELR